MTNIILISNCSRPRLLHQTLGTLYANTNPKEFNLTVVFDGHLHPTGTTSALNDETNYAVLEVEPVCQVLGRLKNLGIWYSERQFGEGEFLLVIDDDLAFSPYWLNHITFIKEHAKFSDGKGPALLGCERHPFHGVNATAHLVGAEVQETDAVAGYFHFMRWATYHRYGPYIENAKGIGQSEDFVYSRRIVEELKGHVGYVYPPVARHCGITNSLGQPATGAEHFERVSGVIYE